MTPTFFTSPTAFRSWLARHHAHETELLVGFHKKTTARVGLSYPEALDEALTFGWIDGVRKSMDGDRYTIRFSPRKARSIWSLVNIRHVKRLIAEGRMHAAGVSAYEARESRRSGIYTYETAPAKFDRATARALAANPRAKAFFDAQPPGYRRTTTNWVMSAKKADTRMRRVALLVAKSAKRQRIDFMKPRS